MVTLLSLAGITIIGVIIETIIRTFILFQDFEFEDTFFYIPIKAVEDFIYYPPSIPIPIVVGLLIVWVLYSIRQVQKIKSTMKMLLFQRIERKMLSSLESVENNN